MVHKLADAGLVVQGIEAGGGVGGTWYWNRYPGARCDVPSLYYSYSWSDELINEWRWGERYSTQPEIEAYANFVAKKYDLNRHYLFITRVTRAHFDEQENLWIVETDNGDLFKAHFCIMATGALSIPNEPNLKNLDVFKGAIYLTARWPDEPVDFSGQRVALIGTGSSGIQSSPMIAEQCEHLMVFQRTPNFSVPAYNAPLGEDEIEAFKENFSAYKEFVQGGTAEGYPVFDTPITEEERRAAEEAIWNGAGIIALSTIPNIVHDAALNDSVASFVRSKIREAVPNPVVAEKLLPYDHPIVAKRPCLDTRYYEMFNRENVTLVDLRETPIEQAAPQGLQTTDQLYSCDAIVFATGFDALTGALLKMDIRGRNGVSLRDQWRDGPQAYLGLCIANFPNLFTIQGPGSPSVLSNMISSGEQHVEWITDCVNYMRKNGFVRIEATKHAQTDWVTHVKTLGEASLFSQANSWYLGANIPGKPRIFMPFIGPGYRAKCRTVAAQGYEGFKFQ
jgi:cation diffusion facilitator CzcD-associated flavoprotein CzcO